MKLTKFYKFFFKNKLRTLLTLGFIIFLFLAILALNSYLSLNAAKSNLLLAKNIIDKVDGNPNFYETSSSRNTIKLQLKAALKLSDSANNSLSGSFGLNAFKYVPYLGNQVNGIDSLSTDVNKTINSVYGLLVQFDSLDTSSGLNGHQIPVSKLVSLSNVLKGTLNTFRTLTSPSAGLIGPLAHERNHFNSLIAKADTELYNAINTLNTVVKFCGNTSPQTYLIVGENNAEMRDQGIPLSYSVMTINNGKFKISSPSRIINLNISQPINFQLPAGTQKVFGIMQPTLLWQSTNATANFNLTGQLMSEMYKQATGTSIDGVIALDVPTLAKLLSLTGPIAIPAISTTITSSNLDTVILHNLYNSVPANDQQFRRDEIAKVAVSILNKLSNNSNVNIVTLAKDLAQEAKGRHLLIWTKNSSEENVINFDGFGGNPSYKNANRTFHLAIENATATKMDYYINATANYNIYVTRSGTAVVNTSVTVTNSAPANAKPSYQLGPDYINSFVPGEYVGRAEFWGPNGSQQLSSVEESGLRLNEVDFKVYAGHSITVNMQTIIPNAVQGSKLSLRFVPQPRMTPITLNVNITGARFNIKNGNASNQLAWNKTENLTWSLSKKHG